MDEYSKGADDHQQWPQWVPYDWFIHRNINNTLHTPLYYYSNPRGKIFQSKEEVVLYLAKQIQKAKRIKKNVFKLEDKVEKKKIKEESELQSLASPKEWPDWLPQDWCIARSHESFNVHYCSPKWKKFRTKDEVLHHLQENSKKFIKKQRTKKVLQSKEYILRLS
ncbi:uncharacterized protein LOC130814291 isoform X2 [Amaranthus tricolor]|uniref:uncharacterized protein LOC130814291 isoform X2 n=1 Tax=Amaranthus tricolor TaxID=29722 RepID=UPI00258D7ECA|nr:uncharacterized protein LOC130814291 isoform X2 [Amaranthus tricolor]